MLNRGSAGGEGGLDPGVDCVAVVGDPFGGGGFDLRFGVGAGVDGDGLDRYFENKEDQFAGVIADLHESLFEAGRSPVSLQEDPTRRCS